MVKLSNSLVIIICISATSYYAVHFFGTSGAINGLAEYQNGKLGLSFSYPENWPKPLVVDDEFCFKDSKSCAVSFNIAPNVGGQNYILGVRINKLSGSEGYNTCSCSSLMEYVKWDYFKTYKDQAVLNDNQTTFRGNQSAWQMEVLNSDSGYKTFVTWAINNNLGYRFLYSGPNDNQFGIFLSDFKKMMDSVNFVSPNITSTEVREGKSPSFLTSPDNNSAQNESETIVPKTPSFLSKNNETEESRFSVSEIEVDSELDNGSKITDNADFLVFNDDDIGFTIQYPLSWETDTESTEHYTVARFVAPDDEADVNIRIFPKGDYKSIKDFGDKEFKESEDYTLLEYYRNSTTLLDGKPAIKSIYLTTYNPSIFEDAFGYTSSTSKAMMVAAMVPEKKSIFAIVYFATSENFNEFLPIVDQIVKSFKIHDKGPIIQEED